MKTPRGIRNHNPLNIERGQPWQGLRSVQTDARFAQFESPDYGIRAAARILINYGKRYGIRTVRQVIARWAPEPENNVDAYVAHVASASGLPADVPLALDEPLTLQRLLPAMILHECGQQPYPPHVIANGIRLALET